MSRAAVALVLLAALPWPLDKLVPDWVEGTLYNPRERTEVARQAYAAEDWDAAVDAADSALRIGPPGAPPGAQPSAADDDTEAAEQPLPDPRLAYNAGTAHLAAGDEKRAVELLEQAAGGAGDDLAPGVQYNLGNARLAAGNIAGAVEAYKETLRRRPDDAAAKHNLEVALRRLDEQMKNPFSEPQESPQGRRPGEDEQSDEAGSREPGEEVQKKPEASDPGRQDDDAALQRTQDEAEKQTRQEDAEAARNELPRFEDQPDMTAEQAAALLQSVENLERRQRQEAAAERARRGGSRGKDW